MILPELKVSLYAAPQCRSGQHPTRTLPHRPCRQTGRLISTGASKKKSCDQSNSRSLALACSRQPTQIAISSTQTLLCDSGCLR